MEDGATYEKEKPISGKYGESIDVLKQDDGIVISIMDYSGMSVISLGEKKANELIEKIQLSLSRNKANDNE